MIRILLIPIILLTFNPANAQVVYLPCKTINDTATLRKYMPSLAKDVLSKIKNEEGSLFYQALASLQTLAGQYNESLESTERLRVAMVKETGIKRADAEGYYNIFDIYNNIRLMQADGDSRSDLALFKWSFPVVMQQFSGQGMQYATAPYQESAAVLQTGWENERTRICALKNDSVPIAAAISFCQAYAKLTVYTPFLTAGKELLRTIDNNNLVIQDSVMITMRDGVQLAAVIVRDKQQTSPQPVILKANIYASADEVQQLKEIVTHGYTGMMLNTRGKYVSTADIAPWEHDAKDIYDALDWLSRQSWCNGKVGMYGGSYVGFTQWAATKYMHPILKTIVPQVAAAPGIDFPMHNGIYSTYMLRWIRNVTNNRLTDWAEFSNTQYWDDVFARWYTSGLAYSKLDSVAGKPSKVFQRWLKHPSYDPYWQQMIPYQKEFANINIPVLTIAGYFDGEQLGSLYYVKEHFKWNPAANHYVVIGPYDHTGAQGSPSPKINGYQIDEAAIVDINQLVFDWFDYTLKDKGKPALLKDKINYQLMGTNTWQHKPSLQAASNDSLTFYLSGKKNGRFRELSTAKQENAASQEVVFSVREDVKSAGGTYNMIVDSFPMKTGVYYISAPATEDFNITGAFTAKLSIIINKKDVDLGISLYQQQPDGKFFPLAGTMQRASYAKDRSKRQLLQPGVPQTVPVTGFFTSKRIEKGSRLVIAVDVMNSRGTQVNYGTGAAVETETLQDAHEPLQIQWLGNSEVKIPVEKAQR
ncbi:CocE/NonD family hydrolase [uncultured Chitinophaga sp.]|uniref:CocE/NonD family hydrolase n=1 Tax=uncultured Chitinophaga sp. TaxID=339340 RepID=UPI0025E345E1|nr:CocE/NonD family hydrolase [uncultured Chitinophaga sp.]